MNEITPQVSPNKRVILIKKVVTFLMLLGFFGWFIPILGFAKLSWLELPNTQANGIETDSKGNIYCASKCYGRVQKYDQQGKYILGIKTKGGTGM